MTEALPLVVSMSGSPLNGSDLVLDSFHHTITLNSNDYLTSISLAISTSSVAMEGYINAQVYTETSLLPVVTASLTADLSLSFPSDVSLNVPGAVVSTTPNDANVIYTVEGTAAGAQLTTTGHINLVAVTADGASHTYGVDFQGNQGILDFEFMAPNGTTDTYLAWAADSLTLHTASDLMFT
jgi:hypothetical protein